MTALFTLDPVLADDTVFLYDLPLCRCLLSQDSLYPWLILVPRVPNTTEIYQLSLPAQQQLIKESSAIAALMATTFNADKMNIAALGNVVNQLHVHHVVRYCTDAAWPKPVWGQHKAVPYSDEALTNMLTRMQDMLTQLPDLYTGFDAHPL